MWNCAVPTYSIGARAVQGARLKFECVRTPGFKSLPMHYSFYTSRISLASPPYSRESFEAPPRLDLPWILLFLLFICSYFLGCNKKIGSNFYRWRKYVRIGKSLIQKRCVKYFKGSYKCRNSLFRNKCRKQYLRCKYEEYQWYANCVSAKFYNFSKYSFRWLAKYFTSIKNIEYQLYARN